MMRTSLAVTLVSVWLAGFGLGGCSSGGDPNRPQTVPAKVTVVYEGGPVEKATVTFVSDQTRGAVGHTDHNGEVELWTFDPGDGVIPGTYDVTIRKLEVLALPDPETVSPEEYTRISRQMNSALAGSPKHLLPKRYSSVETSGLTVEVKDGGGNTFRFELEDK